MLTPDSSRFWPADQYRPGQGQPSFDKQFVRDYLETLDWDKTPPAPALPPDIVAKTQAKYLEAYAPADRPRALGKAALMTVPGVWKNWSRTSSSTCATNAGSPSTPSAPTPACSRSSSTGPGSSAARPAGKKSSSAHLTAFLQQEQAAARC